MDSLQAVARMCALTLAFTLTLSLWGCDPIVISRTTLPKPTPTNLTLTGLKTAADSLEIGAEYPVYGVLRSDSLLSLVDFSLWRGEEQALSEHGIRLLWNDLGPGFTEWDLRTAGEVRIAVDPAAKEGEYTLKIKAAAGDTIMTFPLAFTLFKRYEPKTAATVVGIWRATVPVPALDPPAEILVKMQIDPGGTLMVTQEMATGQSNPKVFVQILKEFSEWHVEAGEFRAQKTSCEYHDPETRQPGTECAAPLEWKSDIVVSRGIWTFVQSGDTTLLVRD